MTDRGREEGRNAEAMHARVRGWSSSRSRRVGVCLALAAASLGGGCSLLENVSGAQCDVDADCASRGIAGSSCQEHVCVAAVSAIDASDDASSGPWACLGHVQDPVYAPAIVTWAQPLVNAIDNAPLHGVSARACSKLDLACSTASLAPDAVSDDAGVVTFPLEQGFDGYLRIGWDASYPTVFYLSPPLALDQVHLPLPLVPSDEFSALVAVVQSGATPDPSLGHLFVGADDCISSFGAGVTFSVDRSGSSSVSAYLIDGFPTASATATDKSGTWIMFNVPPGPILVTATLQATGQRIGVTSGNIAAGQFTVLIVPPTP